MSLLLPETILLVGFFFVIQRFTRSYLLPLSGLFYAMWFYSTQIDHTQEYAYFLTASFFCIWVSFMFSIYERSNDVRKRKKKTRQ